jgi:hypothetical protein
MKPEHFVGTRPLDLQCRYHITTDRTPSFREVLELGSHGGSVKHEVWLHPIEKISGLHRAKREAVLAIYAPMIYTALCVMLLMRATSNMRTSGRGLGPGNRDFFGPCLMASSR